MLNSISAASKTLSLVHHLFTSSNFPKRRVMFYGGPTNSGKTKTAFDIFKNAKSGLFCGPLRMLAKEISLKMNAENMPCSYFSSEEKVLVRNATHYVCTNELASTLHHKCFDTVIIVCG